jgi:predicted transglutaminase-like cysteine proteinase
MVCAKAESIFGSREIASTNIDSFDKWTELWRRHNAQRIKDRADQSELSMAGKKCGGVNRGKCSRKAWEEFLQKQRSIHTIPVSSAGDSLSITSTAITLDLLESVNKYMNRSPYIVDPVNWGVPDYWATPDEFFLKDGDCEDYAISKFVTLKELGVNTSLMRLVILQDENLRVAHAVLAVQLDDKFRILDNQVASVLADDEILHYRPVYSINEHGWWLHQVRRFSR